MSLTVLAPETDPVQLQRVLSWTTELMGSENSESFLDRSALMYVEGIEDDMKPIKMHVSTQATMRREHEGSWLHPKNYK